MTDATLRDPGATGSTRPGSPLLVPRVLSIAGTDPTGGAGTAADLKSITAAGGYGMAVVTSLVAQNTRGVRSVHQPPVTFLQEQLRAVSDDVELDAVKTGMLGTAEVVTAVGDWLDLVQPPVLVVDPVMVATSGDRLLSADAEDAMRAFCRRATVVTPNIPELAVLTGQPPASDENAAIDQARRWAADTGVAVVVKTGHLDGRRTSNTWVAPDGSLATIPSWRVDTTSTHGTGCSLSSALATRLAAGEPPEQALAWATRWLHEAIVHGAALRVGHGHGPVDHGHRARRLAAAADTAAWVPADAVPDALHAPGDLPTTEGPEAAPEVPTSGPWTAALWRASAALTGRMADDGFVAGLGDGTLDPAAFDAYLAQDSRYLDDYARALAALAVRSSTPADTAHWAASAAHCQVAETELHRSWLGDRTLPPASPVTSAYTSFLLARTLADPLVVGAAAVLPCFWLYAHVGEVLPQPDVDHPFARWLAAYDDPGFAAATRATLGVVERLFDEATPGERAAAARAYLTCCRHEVEFFDQALRLATLPVGRP